MNKFSHISPFIIKINSFGDPNFIYGGIGEFFIDWGDGKSQYIDNRTSMDLTLHTYECCDVYNITVYSEKHSFTAGDARVIDVLQWGDTKWVDVNNMFDGCYRLEGTFNDVPNLFIAGSIDSMFSCCTNFTGNVSQWDVSKVTNFDNTFYGCEYFTCDLSQWDMSNALSVYGMLVNCPSLSFRPTTWNLQKIPEYHLTKICSDTNLLLTPSGEFVKLKRNKRYKFNRKGRILSYIGHVPVIIDKNIFGTFDCIISDIIDRGDLIILEVDLL